MPLPAYEYPQRPETTGSWGRGLDHILPWSPRKEAALPDTLTLDFWPPGLTVLLGKPPRP